MRIDKTLLHRLPVKLKDFFIMCVILTVATFICILLRFFDRGGTYVSMIFLLAVFLVSRFTGGYFYGFLATVISIITVNYIFSYPYYEFNMTIAGYPFTIVSMFLVSIITSVMTTQIKERERIKYVADKEKMRSNLLRAISHDLRTPLTSIAGAGNILLESEDKLSKEERADLYREICDDSQWLIRMVENLLSVTRLTKDVGNIEKSLEPAEEIVGCAIEKIKKYYPGSKLYVSVPDEVLFVPVDCVLIEQVIINLVENAVTHGRSDDDVRITVSKKDGYAVFSVIDGGRGFDKSILAKVRKGDYIGVSAGDNDSTKNMGIGLSVCMSIIKSHGGKIKIDNLPEKGAKVTFMLPLEEKKHE